MQARTAVYDIAFAEMVGQVFSILAQDMSSAVFSLQSRMHIMSSSSYAQKHRTASLLMIVKTISRMILKINVPQQQISAKSPLCPGINGCLNLDIVRTEHVLFATVLLHMLSHHCVELYIWRHACQERTRTDAKDALTRVCHVANV
jgi:hypothetical protein